MDDEFEAASLNPKWTQQNSPSSITFADGCLQLVDASNSPNDIGALEQAIAGPFKIRAKVTQACGAIDNRGGIYVRNSGTGNMYAFGVHFSTGATFYVNRQTNFSGAGVLNQFSGTTGLAGQYQTGRPWHYYEIEYDGTTLFFRLSHSGTDGSYQTVFSVAAASFLGTPNAVGVFSDRGTATVTPMVCDWFRRIS